jgi:hypothetical protein
MWGDLTWHSHKIQVVQMLTAAKQQWKCEFSQDILEFVQQYLTILDCLWFSDWSPFPPWCDCEQAEHKVLGLWKSTQSHGNITQCCKMYPVVSKWQAMGYCINLCGGNHNKPAVPAATAKWGYSSHWRSTTCRHNTFPAGRCMPNYSICQLGCPTWCVW